MVFAGGPTSVFHFSTFLPLLALKKLLRLVFTRDGVRVAGGVLRTLKSQSKSKVRVVSEVISSMELET